VVNIIKEQQLIFGMKIKMFVGSTITYVGVMQKHEI
jgi:hypothetical protein